MTSFLELSSTNRLSPGLSVVFGFLCGSGFITNRMRLLNESIVSASNTIRSLAAIRLFCDKIFILARQGSFLEGPEKFAHSA